MATQQDEYHEVLDLVNSKDEVTGTIFRGEMTKTNYKKIGVYVRFVNAFVLSNQGLVWVQTRSLQKFIAPGGLDYSVAEHVLSGESYDQAVHRGFREELGWQLDMSRLASLGTLPPTPTKPVFDKVYALLDYSGKDPLLNREEFTSSEWLARDVFKNRLLNSNIIQKASLLPALTLLDKYLANKK